MHYRRFLENRINSGWRKKKGRKEKERRRENKRKITCQIFNSSYNFLIEDKNKEK